MILNDHFTGFALYDLDRQKMIWSQNADKFFTPASNAKLFTFYTCLNMLADSIPAIKYITRHDSLIFWGTGDPSFLHSGLKSTKGFNFLKNSGKKLFFSGGNYTGGFYGDGWAWDDYNDYYQAEINELPIEDNVCHHFMLIKTTHGPFAGEAGPQFKKIFKMRQQFPALRFQSSAGFCEQ